MTEIQQEAELFAMEVHEGQFRKGEAREPHAVQLEEVVELFIKYGGCETQTGVMRVVPITFAGPTGW